MYQEMGENRVMQVVTNNVASNMAARNMMVSSRSTLFWSSYAAYIIDLMLDNGKLPKDCDR